MMTDAAYILSLITIHLATSNHSLNWVHLQITIRVHDAYTSTCLLLRIVHPHVGYVQCKQYGFCTGENLPQYLPPSLLTLNCI